MSTNDITGDKLQTDVATDKYREGWDRVFGNKKPVPAAPIKHKPKPLNEGLDPIELHPSTSPIIKP